MGTVLRVPLQWLHEYCAPDLSAFDLAERLARIFAEQHLALGWRRRRESLQVSVRDGAGKEGKESG